jgi:hypothetical protein
LFAGTETVAEACSGSGESVAEQARERTGEYVSPAAPEGKAEFDTSRRFYFDARKKMTAADFDAWLASIGARVVASDETLADPAQAPSSEVEGFHATALAKDGEGNTTAPEVEEASATATAAVQESPASSRGASPVTTSPAVVGGEGPGPAAVKPMRVGR